MHKMIFLQFYFLLRCVRILLADSRQEEKALGSALSRELMMDHSPSTDLITPMSRLGCIMLTGCDVVNCNLYSTGLSFFFSHIFWYIVHCPSITSLAGIVRSPQQSEQKMIMIDKYFIFFLSDERYGRVEMVLLLLLSIIAAFNFSLQARGNNYTSICFF